jgi:probable rRNA maturation factor
VFNPWLPLSFGFVKSVTTIAIANQQTLLRVDRARIRRAVRAVAAGEIAARATISVAVVDDAAIGKLNEQFLHHRGPTDVLSFLLHEEDGAVEGEVVVSAETARRAAPRYGWSAEDELLLYVIHGALHLAGYDDKTPAARKVMRSREETYLKLLGVRRTS